MNQNNIPINFNDINTFIKTNIIFEGDNHKKNIDNKIIFSTNVFIPENINSISLKTLNYYTGFIKLVETFDYKTDNYIYSAENKNPRCFLYIYIDQYLINDDIYNHNMYMSKNENMNYNKTIKSRIIKIIEHLNKLKQLYISYIKKIIENSTNYKNIVIYSFMCDALKKKKSKYIGHPSTFGSIIRFIPLFNKNNKCVICINISCSISTLFFTHILRFLNMNRILFTAFNYKTDSPVYKYIESYDNIQQNINNDNIILYNLTERGSKTIIDNSHINKRIPAGAFAFKPYIDEHPHRIVLFNIYLHNLITIFNNNSVAQTNIYIFDYGVDEFIITNILSDLICCQDTPYYDNKNVYYYDKNNCDANNHVYRNIIHNKDILDELLKPFQKTFGPKSHMVENMYNNYIRFNKLEKSIFDIDDIFTDYIEDKNLVGFYRYIPYDNNIQNFRNVIDINSVDFNTLLYNFDEEKVLVLDINNTFTKRINQEKKDLYFVINFEEKPIEEIVDILIQEYKKLNNNNFLIHISHNIYFTLSKYKHVNLDILNNYNYSNIFLNMINNILYELLIPEKIKFIKSNKLKNVELIDKIINIITSNDYLYTKILPEIHGGKRKRTKTKKVKYSIT